MTIGISRSQMRHDTCIQRRRSSIPVTVIEVDPNRITQIKTDEADGYACGAGNCGARKASRVRKSEAGHFAKAGVEAGRGVWELRWMARRGSGSGWQHNS